MTLQANVPYPVERITMDENLPEIQSTPSEKETTQEEKDRKTLQGQERKAALTRAQENVKKRIDEYNKKREDRGEKITDDEREQQRRIIERGVFPVGGAAGDPYFENFNSEGFRGSSIAPFAQELREAGEQGAVTQEFLEDLVRRANSALISDTDELAARRFIEDINARIQRRAAGEPPVEAGQDQAGVPDGQAGPERGRPLRSIEDILRERIEAAADKKEQKSSNPRSLQEVALTIINDEGLDKWGPNGTYPLVEEVLNSDGTPVEVWKMSPRGTKELTPALRVNKQNFLRWFRERMMYHHINNSRDETLQLGNLVGITSEFGSTISVFSMDKDRGQYFRDENDPSGKPDDELANQMKMEIWLFGNMRNYDLLYQKYMGSDSDLPKFLQQLHDKEEITQPESLETIMTMPENYGKEGDTSVGDGVRKAYEIYYYASDLEKLREVLGTNSPFFKKETFINAFRIIERKNPDAPVSELSGEAQAFIDKLFPGGELNEKDFVIEMNPFNAKNKPEFNKRIMREMVRQVIADEYGLDNGLNPDTMKFDENGKLDQMQRDLVRNDLVYAETFAWVLTRWTGAAARNDTGAIGFDALTKTMKLRDYRKRQSSETRAGAFGNEYDVPVFKGLTVDFFNGITIEKHGKEPNITPFEVFRKMDEIEEGKGEYAGLSEPERIKLKRDWAKRLNFEQYLQRSYASDHINRGFEVFHSIMGAEEMRLEEIVKWDPFRGIILDRGKFEEQIKEKFIKPTRYAFNTYGQLDLGKKMRYQVGGFRGSETPVYQEMTVAENLFGPEVLADLRPKAEKYYKEKLGKRRLSDEEKERGWSEYLSDPDGGRGQVWKRAVMARMAANIKSHRQFANNYTPFTAGMVDALYEALASIRSIDVEEEGDRTKVEYDQRFLDKKDLEWIRKRSGTTRGRLILDGVPLVAWGAISGTAKGLKDFFEGIFK